MSCCGHNRAAGRFFSFFARNYRKRFEKKGFTLSQKHLLEGLQQAGYIGASVLEIGSGAGNLHQTLLEKGAACATGVDLAPKMIEEARKWAHERNLDAQVDYKLGDFVELADTVAPAGVTVLDKVICCYPDADSLVHKSLSKTQRVYALTFPRYNWFSRMISQIMAAVFWLIRFDFRNYIHNPELVESWITAAGFRRVYQNATRVWQTEVYVRD